MGSIPTSGTSSCPRRRRLAICAWALSASDDRLCWHWNQLGLRQPRQRSVPPSTDERIRGGPGLTSSCRRPGSTAYHEGGDLLIVHLTPEGCVEVNRTPMVNPTSRTGCGPTRLANPTPRRWPSLGRLGGSGLRRPPRRRAPREGEGPRTVVTKPTIRVGLPAVRRETRPPAPPGVPAGTGTKDSVAASRTPLVDGRPLSAAPVTRPTGPRTRLASARRRDLTIPASAGPTSARTGPIRCSRLHPRNAGPTERLASVDCGEASARNLMPRAATTRRTVSRLGTRSPERAL